MVPFGPLHPGAASELFPLAKSKRIGTVAMKPFGGGEGFMNLVRSGAVANPTPDDPATSGKPYQAAIKWVLQEKNLDCTVPGMMSVLEMDQIVSASKLPLDATDERILGAYKLALAESGANNFLEGKWD